MYVRWFWLFVQLKFYKPYKLTDNYILYVYIYIIYIDIKKFCKVLKKWEKDVWGSQAGEILILTARGDIMTSLWGKEDKIVRRVL